MPTSVRNAIGAQVRQLLGSGDSEGALTLTEGDAGWFGPQSVCWKVHGDFTSMMIGGVSALLMQMLHPRALAGVWDHSNFRQDMQGRLRRTARFIAGTTYGSTQDAQAMIDRVKRIHGQVRGHTADGAAYTADDPDLLTWVHVAEVWSFMAAYLRYRDPNLPVADQDRYYAETALVARKLGATEVPETRAAVEAYLAAMRPKLRCDARTREVARALLTHEAASPALAPAGKLIFAAAQDLLPPWAAKLHGFYLPISRRPAVRLGVRGMGGVLRWGLQNGAEARARRRTSGDNRIDS
jgi:uncharacterized protein (DUF2236 family)